jgi:predicted ATPase
MAITQLSVSGYRSIRSIYIQFQRINILVGANGCGKSNLYQSMYLLASAANGELARALAAEGGMPSALWAGGNSKVARVGRPAQGSTVMTLGFRSGDLEYEFSCGLPPPLPVEGAFALDPHIKSEKVWFHDKKKRVVMLDRGPGSAWLRDSRGERVDFRLILTASESVLAQLREPHRFPQLSALHQEMLSWRFYHGFRTDADAPLRHPQIGVFTPVLSRDGSDLAAALCTIMALADGHDLQRALEQAFPGSCLLVDMNRGRFSLTLQMPGLARPFDARELSDGTIRYLCLLAALLTPKPPGVLALNEPETSLHPDLLEPLAHLIVRASRDAQLWVTTHSTILADHIARLSGVSPVRLEKVNGETQLEGDRFPEFIDQYGPE